MLINIIFVKKYYYYYYFDKIYTLKILQFLSFQGISHQIKVLYVE